MPNRLPNGAPQRPAIARSASLAAFARLIGQLRAFSPSAARRILMLVGVIIVILLANTFGQLRLNKWQGAFYDSLARRDLSEFQAQILTFFVIVSGLLVLVVMQNWVTETLKVKGRAWVTAYLLKSWLAPRRPYLLRFAGDIAQNPDQRMAQDSERLAELSVGFIIGIAQSSLLLVSFVGVLWSLSSRITFGTGAGAYSIPGYMVWCALAFSLAGSLLTFWVGRPLIPGNVARYESEGAFRAQIARVSDNAEAIAIGRGEGEELEDSESFLDRLIRANQRIANLRARLTWVTSGYGWIGLVFPMLVASPGYFWGTLTLGELMMVVGGFNQVQNALRWFIDQYASIAEWQAVLLRVATLADAVQAEIEAGPSTGRIAFTTSAKDEVVLKDVWVCLPPEMTTCVALPGGALTLRPGDRVLLAGGRGSGKTTLFMTLAGLWPWGHGTISLPEPLDAVFLSERPYLPRGSLLRVLAYPAPESSVDVAKAEAAMQAAGLPELATRLHDENNWMKDLGLGEQQRLAVARLLLNPPRWLFCDNAFNGLDDEAARALLTTLAGRLPDLGVLAMAGRNESFGYFTKIVALANAPAPLPPSVEPAA